MALQGLFIILGVMLTLLFLGVPIAYGIGIASLTAILLAILLTVSAMIVPLSAAETPTYADVKKNDWFYDSVYKVCEANLMIGTSETTFAPKEYITTAECVTLLARMHARVTGNTAATDSLTFS